jgi:hypothetical protein
MSSLTFYREQAEFQMIAADTASLPQVRSRCLRAATAWTELADRAQKLEDARKVKAAQDQLRLSESVGVN